MTAFDPETVPPASKRPRRPRQDDPEPEEWRPPLLPYVPPEHLTLPMEMGTKGKVNPTEPLCVELEHHILNGTPVRAAKYAVGITRDTWKHWEGFADAGKQPYATFMERVRCARAHTEGLYRRVIAAGAQHADARIAIPAAETALKMEFPERYATRTASRVDANVNGKVEAALTAVEESDLLRAAADVLTSRGDDDLADLIRARITS